MKDAIVFTLLLIFVLSFESAYADTYRVRCGWDAVTPTATNVPLYGYEILVDSVQQVINMASATPSCDETFTAAAGVTIEGRFVNINNLFPAVPETGNWLVVAAQVVDSPPDVTNAYMLTVQSP